MAFEHALPGVREKGLAAALAGRTPLIISLAISYEVCLPLLS
jgi:hypothetical protein